MAVATLPAVPSMTSAPAGRSATSLIVAGWREFGWLGRAAVFGLVVAVGIAIALGFSIPRAVKHHVLEAETDIMAAIAADLTAQGLIPVQGASPSELERFDEEVRLRLLGGETVRVKVWAPDGTVIYSDAEDLIGRRFELTAPAVAALGGTASNQVSDLSDPAHDLERDLGRLIEFYLPIRDGDGAVVAAFEVEQNVEALDDTLGRVQRNVWFSIALGLIVLMLFLGVLAFAGARASQRRRRQTEMLLSDLLEARESERRRIVGALHGDVGQPLYRLLYGIEGSRAKIDQPEVIDEELQRLSELVRDIDAILRAELRLLHRAEIADVGLGPAIAELVETTRTEAGLDIELSYEVEGTVDNVPGSALLWACEEGLFNVRKHADASRVTVRVWRSGATLSVEVVDDGVGVDGPEGLGLRTTRERLSAIGGGLDVRRQRGGGTRFGAWVPATSEASR